MSTEPNQDAQSAQTADVRGVDKIEARDFTYCQYIITNPFESRAFLVSSPFKRDALPQAHAFMQAHGWPAGGKLYLYPRTYVAKARPLLAHGLADFA